MNLTQQYKDDLINAFLEGLKPSYRGSKIWQKSIPLIIDAPPLGNSICWGFWKPSLNLDHVLQQFLDLIRKEASFIVQNNPGKIIALRSLPEIDETNNFVEFYARVLAIEFSNCTINEPKPDN